MYQWCSRVHNLRVQVQVLYIQVRVRVQVPSKISSPNFSSPSPKYLESKSEMIKYMYNHISTVHNPQPLNAFLQKSRCNQSNMVVANRQWRIGEGATAPPPHRHSENHFLKKAKSVEKLGGRGTHYMLEAEAVLKRNFENAEMLSHRT